MTFPGGDIGKATVDVVFDAHPETAEREVREALVGQDAKFKKAGNDWSDALAHGFEEKLQKEAPKIAKEVEATLGKQKITQKLQVDTDIDNDHLGASIHKLVNDVEREFTTGEAGNLLKRIGTNVGNTISDGIGAGFNVSGRSPLIAILLPAIGGIVALFGAAAEAVYAFGGALLTIPTILSAMALQAGVLALVFHSVGDNISAAFAAKNPKELQAALKDLDPSIKNFILDLLQWRDIIDQIGNLAAIAFFRELGSVLRDIARIAGPVLAQAFIQIADALGRFWAIAGQALTSKAFLDFINNLAASTNRFLTAAGPSFEKFLEAVFRFLNFMISPADKVGKLFINLLDTFGDFLAGLTHSKGFQEFLDRLPDLLVEGAVALLKLVELFLVLLQTWDKAGGEDFLKLFIGVLQIMIDMLSSDAGIQSFKVLIFLVELLMFTFLGLFTIFLTVFAFLNQLWYWLTVTIPDALHAAWDFLTSGLMWQEIKDALINIKDKVVNWFEARGADIANFFSVTVPNKVKAIWESVKQWWKTKGNELMTSFVEGLFGIDEIKIKHKFQDIGGTIGKSMMEGAAAYIPHSPAEKGPFSGSNSPMDRGIKMIRDIAAGVNMGIPALTTATSNAMQAITIGPGAVNANFYGSNPTPDQAQTLGESVGMGLTNTLAARNTALAVRSM